jgi:hypothetical protein
MEHHTPDITEVSMTVLECTAASVIAFAMRLVNPDL